MQGGHSSRDQQVRQWTAGTVVRAVVIAANRPGPTSAQPISRSGPTASKATLPSWPAMIGSAVFSAKATTLEKINSRRAGRSCAGVAPWTARCRVPSSRPTTDKSTAGATNGATQPGTPSRRAEIQHVTEPKEKRQPNYGGHDHGHRTDYDVWFGQVSGQTCSPIPICSCVS